MLIDTDLWNLVQENKAAVIRALIRQFDPSQGSPYPIYTEDGEFTYERSERWLAYDSDGVTKAIGYTVDRARQHQYYLALRVPR
jgi:hypothetical protein